MISYIYTPVAGGNPITALLIDSDRFWPPDLAIQASGEVQQAKPPRANSSQAIGRGNAIVPVSFTAYRQFASVFLAEKHKLFTLPALCGTSGTLVIEPPGGRLRQINTACKTAAANSTGTLVICRLTFEGPLFVLG